MIWVFSLLGGLLPWGAWGQTLLCEGGMAGPYPCDGVDQLGFLGLEACNAAGANDVWGWCDDLTGKEYALLGLNNGLAFVDVTDPFYPVYLGKLPTATSTSLWRDMKVAGHHAYVVSEAFAHGLQVFDLHWLREAGSTPDAFLADATLTDFSDAHNLTIDEASNRLYVVGTNLADGGVLIYDISDPGNPTLVGMYEEGGYVHDAVAGVYAGPDPDHSGASLLFCAHPTHFSILDVTDASDVQVLSTGMHPSNGYTHQPCWLPDGQRLLIGDELDEQQYGFNTRTVWWDVSDLDAPAYGGAYFGPTTASDHNQYADAAFVYQSNYTAGLRILKSDDTDGFSMQEVASFDVHPASDAVGFTGSWSNYPFLPSGNLLVSSMESGLHILRPNWLEAEFSSLEVCQNDTAFLQVTVPKDLGVEFTFSVNALPGDIEVLGMPLTTYGTGTWEFGVVGLPTYLGAVEMVVSMAAGDWTWHEQVSVNVDGGTVWFRDADGDGFGDPNHPAVLCSSEPGYADNALDCFDASAAVYPGAAEQCDAMDNDCNGWVDDGMDQIAWYRDMDQDGYGSMSFVVENCYCPAGFVAYSGDCNDNQPFIYPDAPGNQSGADNNCDGIIGPDEVNPCPGDFNLDNQVTVSDLLVILFDYACMADCESDMNGDGMVSIGDMLLFLSAFSMPCSD